jgi:hypothetical protein
LSKKSDLTEQVGIERLIERASIERQSERVGMNGLQNLAEGLVPQRSGGAPPAVPPPHPKSTPASTALAAAAAAATAERRRPLIRAAPSPAGAPVVSASTAPPAAPLIKQQDNRLAAVRQPSNSSLTRGIVPAAAIRGRKDPGAASWREGVVIRPGAHQGVHLPVAPPATQRAVGESP